jgi:hypothetical protein
VIRDAVVAPIAGNVGKAGDSGQKQNQGNDASRNKPNLDALAQTGGNFKRAHEWSDRGENAERKNQRNSERRKRDLADEKQRGTEQSETSEPATREAFQAGEISGQEFLEPGSSAKRC